jgi:hypothetical protein
MKPEGSYPNLRYADDDALSVSAILDQQGYEVVPYTRVDSDATKDHLIADIATIAGKATTDDLLLIYYSGHGGQGPADPIAGTETASGADSYEEWIFLYGSIDGAGNPILDQTVNDDELAALLRTDALRCPMKIVVIDACNSGGFVGNQLEHDGVPPDYIGSSEGFLEGLVRAISLYGDFDGYGSDVSPHDAMVLAAAGEREESLEGYYGHGVFTYFLLTAPTRADVNRDGYVTVRETYDYVRRQIDMNWNINVSEAFRFAPHVSGGPVDYVMFASGQ